MLADLEISRSLILLKGAVRNVVHSAVKEFIDKLSLLPHGHWRHKVHTASQRLTVHPDPGVWENGSVFPQSFRAGTLRALSLGQWTRMIGSSLRWGTKCSICADPLVGGQEEAQCPHGHGVAVSFSDFFLGIWGMFWQSLDPLTFSKFQEAHSLDSKRFRRQRKTTKYLFMGPRNSLGGLRNL